MRKNQVETVMGAVVIAALQAAGCDPVVAIGGSAAHGGLDVALVPDLYHRSAPWEPFDPDTIFIDRDEFSRAIGLADTVGSIEIGKSADIIVLDRNVLETPAEDLADTKVLTTWFAGRVVYERA